MKDIMQMQFSLPDNTGKEAGSAVARKRGDYEK